MEKVCYDIVIGGNGWRNSGGGMCWKVIVVYILDKVRLWLFFFEENLVFGSKGGIEWNNFGSCLYRWFVGGRYGVDFYVFWNLEKEGFCIYFVENIGCICLK